MAIVLAVVAGPTFANDFFSIQVVDSETGRGIPLVELFPNDGPTLITDSNGMVAFNEPGLMDQNIFFGFRSYGHSEWGQTLHPTAGSSVTVAIDRRNRAERLYRVTGSGIYRDSVLVGADVPIDQPLLNANVSGQDSVQTAIYQGKIHWFWGDTLYEDGGFNFRASGATSELLGQGGPDPSQGVNLTYFTSANGNAKQIIPTNQPGLVWLTGLFTATDPSGRERMLSQYSRVQGDFSVLEHGLALWNDTMKIFQPLDVYDPNVVVEPQGHAFRHTVDGEDYIYFSLAYPNVRVKDDWDHITDITKWEAFTPLQENSRYNSLNPPLDLDGNGNPIFGWKKNADPLDYIMVHELVQNGHVERSEMPFRLQDFETGRPILMHRSSVHWNEYRQAWIMIGNEIFGDSFVGEIWFSEAPTPEGLWENAVQVATHDGNPNADYSFYNPTSHPFFDQEGGRFIYFEGTYSNTFSGNPVATPLYDYNQIMYRLDLATIPNLFDRLPGDYDRNGVVDAADYAVWRDTLGSDTFLAADGSGNSIIDAADYDVWKTNFGRTATSLPAAAGTVPEPEIMHLVFLAGVLIVGRLSRRG